MVTLVRPIKIYTKQAEFRRSEAWLRAFCAGRGCGKTFIGALDVTQQARRGEPWLGVAPDNNMAREVMAPVLEEVLKRTGQYKRHVVSPTPKFWFKAVGGGTASITLRGAEKPDKLLGRSVAGLWFEEASTVSREVFDKTVAVCRYRGRMGKVLLTFTPRGFKHWTFDVLFSEVQEKEFNSLEESRRKVFQGRYYKCNVDTHLVTASTKDNPFLAEEFYSRISGHYTSMLAAQELEGEFVELNGTMFDRPRFRLVDKAPRDAQRVRYWDKASTEGDGCYSAGVLLAKDSDGIIYVEDVVRGQWSALERNRIIKETCANDQARFLGEVLTYIEQEGAGSGKDVNEALIRELGEYSVFSDPATASAKVKIGGVLVPGDAKVRRAMPFAAQVQGGNVRVCSGSWVQDFLNEICAFPLYSLCDQVDAASAGYLKLAKSVPYNVHAEKDLGDRPTLSYGDAFELTSTLPTRMPWDN